MPFRDAEPASPITRGVFASKNGFSPTRLGSDLRRFLLHAELTPSSARWDLSERLLSSSLPFQIYFIPYNFLTAFAKAVETTIFVKNAPSYAGIGFNSEGHTTFTIAGPTGEGITSAKSFTRQRRCVMAESFRII